MPCPWLIPLLLAALVFAGFLFFLLWKRRRKTASRILILAVWAGLVMLPPLWIYKRQVLKSAGGFIAILCSKGTGSSRDDGNTCACTWSRSGLKSDDYYDHLRVAKNLPLTKQVKDENLLRELDSRGVFEEVDNHPSLELGKLSHSHAVVHENANESIRELSKRFRKKLEGSKEEDARFVISSITRTTGQHKQIQRLYPNAVHGSGESAHCYGAAIDINAVRTSGDCSRARRALYEVLREMQKERKILLMAESKCIHITFR